MLDFVLAALIFMIAIPLFFLVLQILVAVASRAKLCEHAPRDLSGTVVLVPAHNEGDVIEKTLRSVMAELPEKNQVVVVADNCSDSTETIASNLGATVAVRKDDSAKGKGFALKFGVDYLASRDTCPQYVVVIDADCVVKPGTINALVSCCIDADGRPVQALDLMKASDSDNMKLKIAEFAWIVKNQVRPLGLKELGLPCQLMGTGMLIPFELLRDIELGTSDIVEDMRLGIECALAGYAPVFCPDGRVESFFPVNEDAQKSQRQRWEHGHLGMVLTMAPKLMRLAVRKGDRNLIAMALDLLVPPLSLVILLSSILLLLLFLFAWSYGEGQVAFYLFFTIFAFLISSLIFSWNRYARQVISVSELIWIPVYVLSKIPLYLRYWISRQTEWVRTKRD